MTKLPISLCMIVKNEEEMLEQCLMAAMPLVRQIVVIDTGSTDRTVTIAESLGAEVHQFQWVDDFAAARNYSLTFAREEWILILDVDEIVDQFSLETLSRFLADPRLSSLEVTINNLNDRGPSQSFNLIRIFRNETTIRFKNVIHEGVAEAILKHNKKKSRVTLHSGITIRHFGYLQEKLVHKGERNLTLIQKSLQENPENLYFLMKEYEELEKLGRSQECNTKIKIAYDLMLTINQESLQKLPFAPMIIVNFVQLLLDEQQWIPVIETSNRWLKVFQNEPWLLYMRSIALMNAGDFEEAEAGFNKCRKLDIRPRGYYVEPGISSWLALQGLAEIEIQRRNFATALAILEEVKEENPDYFPALIKLFEVHILMNEPGEAMKVVTGILSREKNNTWALVNGANLLHALKMNEKAIQWCKTAMAIEPGLSEAENLLLKIQSN